MTKDQEIKLAHAVQLMDESGAVYILAYGFPGSDEVYVEGRGDKPKDHQEKFVGALAKHWGIAHDS